MIQITDYRVGNYLLVDRVPRRISLINADDGFEGAPYVGFSSVADHPYERCSSPRLEPVPLSDDLLSRVGMQPQLNSRLLHLPFSEGIYILEVDGDAPGVPGVNYQQVRCKVRYLHQLQNLYHALTGAELSLRESAITC